MENIFKTISPSCCAPAEAGKKPGLDQSFITGSVATAIGDVPRVTSDLRLSDYWGSFKARWDVGRMDYRVDPGLYAIGSPDAKSPVLVSANYKMSFDQLRQAVAGVNAWILVLDTEGINVWCAAGDGTFGTKELVKRIELTELGKVVAHRDLIVPQLAGPGVSAHKVKELSGFNVNYGPVSARDIPAYINAGLKATREMRRKTFDLAERMVLIPVELVHAMRPAFLIVPILFLLGGIGGPGSFWANASFYGFFAVLAFMSAVVGGTVVNPVLLPYLPGRAFSTKGLFSGFLIACAVLYMRGFNPNLRPDLVEAFSWLLIITALSSYMALNYTGCSTFTSLSGVKKEMRWALPMQGIMTSLGLAGWITSRLIS